jgi:dTDP-4-amino-4,6-dideoxygalactose transaminase
MSDKPIYVTQPVLPPLDEFMPYLEKIWASKQLSNGGAMHQQLEQALCDYLGVPHVCLFNNGTNALLTALQALSITDGEVITTPYSFVATANAIVWNGLTPVFVDIDPVSLNLDPSKIEAAITDKTKAIMPVHCYGNPCDVAAIQAITDKYQLKVIYDAAHAFAVEDAGGSILRHGDLSVLSFHATKVFNTFEGGAIICHDEEMKTHIDRLKNFGFVNETTVVVAGINGKMSEINAAFGLLQLSYIDEALAQRKAIDEYYREILSSIVGVFCVPTAGQSVANYSYFPILIDKQYSLTRNDLYEHLKANNIYSRRYFYPLITDFPMYKDAPSTSSSNLIEASVVADKVICLPIYPSMEIKDLERICELIRGC